MAIAVVTDLAGATVGQYDQVILEMGHSPGGTAPPGCLFHYVTKADGGIRVTDVWESRAQFEAFAREQIGPLSAKVGMPNPPQISFVEVHNYLAAG